MSGELICRSCGKVNDESRDFCEKCGEYLRWELTRTMPSAIQVQGATPGPMAVPGTGGSSEPAAGSNGSAVSDGSGGSGDATADDGWDEPTGTAGLIHSARGGDTLDDAEAAPNTNLLTQVMPALGDPGPGEAPPVPVTGGATLVVRSVGVTALEQGEAAIGSVDPGSRITYEFMLRNVSNLVDNYDLVVGGLPEGWAAVTPETAYLVPYGSGGSSDQLVRVTVTPPRATASEARVWPFELIALSRAGGGIAARAAAGAEVGAFNAWDLTPVPALRAGRFRGRYAVTVGNLGNAPIELWMYATEAEDRLRGNYANPMLPLSPGESRITQLTVKPPRPKLIGRHYDRYVTLEALPDAPEPEEPTPPLKERLKKYFSPGGVSVGPRGVTVRKPRARMPRPPTKQLKLEDLKRMAANTGPSGPTARTQVTFRHKPVISTWMILLALLIAAAIAAYILTRTKEVTVPQLYGARDAFVAQQKLQKDGLTLNPVEQQKPSTQPPGSIVGQLPIAGTKVKKGSQVTLEVAVSTGRTKVPSVAGDTRAEADTALRKADLSLGAVEPVTAPLDWIVKQQIPQAGGSVADGTAIQLYLEKPPSKSSSSSSKTNGSSNGPSGSKRSSSGKGKSSTALTVPAVAEDTPAKAETALRKAGLVPELTSGDYFIDGATKAGEVAGTEPAGGTPVSKGAKVTVYVSLGLPDFAFDNGAQITLINSVSGKVTATVSGPDPEALQPSFSPDGKEFVYRSDSRVFVTSTAKPSKPVPIYEGQYPLSNVTFSPDPNAQVLALDRQVNGIGDLCLARLSAAVLSTSCLPDDTYQVGSGIYGTWNLDGTIAWSPNGKEILAEAVSSLNSSTFGLVEYTSKVPFSTNAADWSGGTIQTDTTEPGKGVLSAAFEPDGTYVAIISNLVSSQYEMSLVQPTSLDPTTNSRTLSVSACEVAWRADSLYLAILEGNSTCTQSTGTIVQVKASKDLQPLTVIRPNATDLTYQSLDAASVSH